MPVHKRVHVDMREYRRILIMKPSSLGDVVQALPTLAALRRMYRRAHIAWLVKQQWAGLLERAEGLDRIWTVGSGMREWMSLVSKLRQEQFDLVVDLQGLFRSAALAWTTGCPTRIGFANAREGSPLFYTHRVQVETPDMHAVDRYLLVAHALCLEKSSPPEFHLQDRQADRDEVARLLARHGLQAGTRWIAVNASARWPTKRWPPEFFAAVADQIEQENLGRIVLIGGPDEQETAKIVAAQMRLSPVNLTGTTMPAVLPALLRSTALLLTNDSGPMHIAAAVKTPVVALFGPTSPRRTGPYGSEHRVLRRELPCSPCFKRTCRNSIHLECLKTIDPDTVMEAVRGQLADKRLKKTSYCVLGSSTSTT